MEREPSPLSTLLVVGLFIVAAKVVPPVLAELLYVERTRPRSLRRYEVNPDLDETDRWLDDLEERRKGKRFGLF